LRQQQHIRYVIVEFGGRGKFVIYLYDLIVVELRGRDPDPSG
jgi:hypothetical protein